MRSRTGTRLIDASQTVTVQAYDRATEKWKPVKVTIAEALDLWTDEGCPEPDQAEVCRYCGGQLSEKREHNGRGLRHCFACHFDFYEEAGD